MAIPRLIPWTFTRSSPGQRLRHSDGGREREVLGEQLTAGGVIVVAGVFLFVRSF
jgi:hypothetical protein